MASESAETNSNEEEENEKSMTYAAGSDLVPFDGLTMKQYLFINAYLGEAKGNATEAAALAGYSGSRDVLRSMAAENLAKPAIVAQVRAAAKAVMGEHEVVNHLADVIRKDDLAYAQEYRNKHGATVAVKMDMNSKVKAIELMLRYHGVLTDKVEHSGTVEQQVKQMIVHVHAGSGEAGSKAQQQ
jgi:phage terminase small subunit